MKNLTKAIKIIAQLILIGFSGYYLFMFVCPVFHRIVNIGNILGILLSFTALLSGVFLDKIISFCKRHYKNKTAKAALNTAFTVLGVGIICFCLTMGSIITSAKTDACDQNTVIILGCAVRGTTPSFTLKSRINAAFDYLEKNPESVAVLSGGQGKHEDISEALCMYNILTEKGIDPKRVYLEDKSTNTYENLTFSKKIIEQNKLSDNIAVVSSDYHLKRATMLCKKAGFNNVKRISAPSTYFDKPTFYLRELLGVVKEFIFP